MQHVYRRRPGDRDGGGAGLGPPLLHAVRVLELQIGWDAAAHIAFVGGFDIEVNWAALGPSLSKTCRVLALDLAGFGRTRSHGRSTSVHANQRLLHRFLTQVCQEPAILVGNSMGGLIAVLQTAAHPETVAGVVLIDPALPVGLAARPDPRSEEHTS